MSFSYVAEIVIILFLSLLGTLMKGDNFIYAKDIKISFLIDPVQKGITDDIASALKDIKQLNLEANIQDAFVVVENDEDMDKDKPANAIKTFCEIIQTIGTSVVIDFTYLPWVNGLDLISVHKIPYLRVERIISPILKVFGEFLHQKGSNDVALIFQNDQDTKESLYHIVDGFPFRSILLNAAEATTFVKRLKQLRPSPSYYAIFAESVQMNDIYEKISKAELFERPDEWHFIFMDPNEKVFKYQQAVEFATRFSLNARELCQSLVLEDSYCAGGFNFRRTLLREIFRGLIDLLNFNDLIVNKYECKNISSFMNGSQTNFQFLNKLKLNDFMTYSMHPEEEEDHLIPSLSYMVNMSITIFSGERSPVSELAVWQSNELRKVNETITPAKRFFRIGTTEAIPWSYYRRDPQTGDIALDEKGKPIWEGFCIDFIETLAKRLHFDYQLVPPTSGKFGDRDPETGHWDGIVGDLVSGETDLAITALKMYSEREEVIDYIAPYFDQTGISIVIRKPVRQTSLFKFMTVLRVEVWLSIVAALVATAVMIWLMDKYSPYSSRNNKTAYPYPCREFTLRESFWFALTSFTPQGGGEAPKAVSSRILVAAYWLFVVLMLATFTANLAAFLTVERMQTPVQSLEQLARQSRINYTVVADSDIHQYFINMKFAEDTLYRMWKELALNATTDFSRYRIWDYPIKEQYSQILLAINASNPVRTAEEGFRQVNEHENADFAFIHDSSEIKYAVTRNCNFTEVGEVFAEQPYAVAVQQGSHIMDEFSYTILELQKDRYFEELKAKYWNRSALKDCPQSDGQEGITLESLGGVFIATLFGLGFAMLTLGIEVLYYSRKRKATPSSSSNIVKVVPMQKGVPPRVKDVWWISDREFKLKRTPPPSFEAVTFRGRNIPRAITLGGPEFRPRRGELNSQASSDNKMSNKINDLPPYVE